LGAVLLVPTSLSFFDVALVVTVRESGKRKHTWI
jgi:hypothetical protein